MAGAKPTNSLRSLFKRWVLLLLCEHTFPLINSVVISQEKCQTNSVVHTSIKTWDKYHLHIPNAKLPVFQKCICNTSIKVYKFSWCTVVLVCLNWHGEENDSSLIKSHDLLAVQIANNICIESKKKNITSSEMDAPNGRHNACIVSRVWTSATEKSSITNQEVYQFQNTQFVSDYPLT